MSHKSQGMGHDSLAESDILWHPPIYIKDHECGSTLNITFQNEIADNILQIILLCPHIFGKNRLSAR